MNTGVCDKMAERDEEIRVIVTELIENRIEEQPSLIILQGDKGCGKTVALHTFALIPNVFTVNDSRDIGNFRSGLESSLFRDKIRYVVVFDNLNACLCVIKDIIENGLSNVTVVLEYGAEGDKEVDDLIISAFNYGFVVKKLNWDACMYRASRKADVDDKDEMWYE